MAELASSRGRHVLMHGSGDLWDIIWPQGSWENEHGRVIVADAVALPGQFAVGLHVVPRTRLITLYDGDNLGYAGSAAVLARRLEAMGWSRGQTIVAVTQRSPGDQLTQLLEELSETLDADIWYPSPGHDGELMTTGQEGGDWADAAEIVVPGGYVSVSYGVHTWLRRWLRSRVSISGVFDLMLDTRPYGLHGAWTHTQNPYTAHYIRQRLRGWGWTPHSHIRLLVDEGARFTAEMASLATALGNDVLVTPMGARLEVTDVVGGDGSPGRDIIAVDQGTGQPVAWQVIHPEPSIHPEELPSVLEARPDGTIRFRTEPVITPGGAIYFPGAGDYLTLGSIALGVPRHPALVTILVNVGPGGFETLRADGTPQVLDAREFGARLRPFLPDPNADIRVIWRPYQRDDVPPEEASLMRRLAEELERVLWWPGEGDIEFGDDLVIIDPDDKTSVGWRQFVPIRADGSPAPANNAIDSSGYLVPQGGPRVEVVRDGVLRSASERWQERFGQVIEAAEPFPGQFILGLEVGPTRRLSFYYGDGLHATAGPGDIQAKLRDHGWRGETLLIVMDLQPDDEVQNQLSRLADDLRADIYVLREGATLAVTADRRLRADSNDPRGPWVEHRSRPLWQDPDYVPVWFAEENGVMVPSGELAEIDYEQGFATMGMTGYLARRHLLARRPEPGLFDLWLEHNYRGELGFADRRGRFVPANLPDLPNLPDDTHEVRLIVDDGARLHKAVTRLATHYLVPVWVTPDGARVDLEDSRLIARSRDSGDPVAWIQVMPSGRPDPRQPWYDTTSGLFEQLSGDVVIGLRGPGGEARGMLAVGQGVEYYSALDLARVTPRVLDGMYVVSVRIDPATLTFSLDQFSGESRPIALRALPGVLREHGWTEGLAIVIMPRFTSLPGGSVWERVVGEYGAIARAAGVTVYFPDMGSESGWLYGDVEPAVWSAGRVPQGRWASMAPRRTAGRPEFVQDMAGRLRHGADTGVVSLSLTRQLRTRTATLHAGVASPSDPGRIPAYRQARSDPRLSVFFVDVPLTDDGQIAVVTSATGGISPADTDQVVELITRGRYDSESQVLQFLASPPTQQAYDAYVDDVQGIADVLRRSVFTVQGPGVTVGYDPLRETFVSRSGGRVADWREILPRPLSLAGRPVRVDHGVIVIGDLAEPPAQTEHARFDGTSGEWVRRGDDPAGRAGELAAYVRDGRRREDVITIAASDLSWLGEVSAEQVGKVLSALGFPRDPARPVRLVSEREPDPEPVAGWLRALASERGSSVYLGSGAWYRWWGERDLAATSWLRYRPQETSGGGALWPDELETDEDSGLLLPASGYGPDIGQPAGPEQALSYFETDSYGALVPAVSDPVMTFGNLVTFEPLESLKHHLDDYLEYQDRGRGLPIVVVGTREGAPAGSGPVDLAAAWTAQVVASLGLADQPVRLVGLPLDDFAPALGEWAADFAAELQAPVYLGLWCLFSDPLSDFVAEAWPLYLPDPGRVVAEELPEGLAAVRQEPVQSAPMPRYVRNPVNGLLVAESLEENPLHGWHGETELAWQQRGASLDQLDIQLIVGDGQVRGLVLPGPAGPARLPGVPEVIPDGQFVVVAYGAPDQVTGWLRLPGPVTGEAVGLPPAQLAALIRAVEDYVPGTRVVLLVPALAQNWRELALPERYAQRVADLLGATVEATFQDDPRGLAARRYVFDPLRPQLERSERDGRMVGLVSLSPEWEGQDLRATPSYPADLPPLYAPEAPAEAEEAVQVFLPAFEDGSLGLYYSQPEGDVQDHPVTARTIALALAPVVGGRSLIIRPVAKPGTKVSLARLEAAIAEVHASLRSVIASGPGGGAAGEFRITAGSRPEARVAGRDEQEETRERAAVVGKQQREREARRHAQNAVAPAPVRGSSTAGVLAGLPRESGGFWAHLSAEGWTYRPVNPDGDCLFASLELLIPDRLPEHEGIGQLRGWLADRLAADLRLYREGWGDGEPPRWAPLLSYDDGVAGQAGEAAQQEEWVRQTRAVGVWNQQVGDLWPQMVADLTGPLVVLQPGQPPLLLGENMPGEPRYLIRVGNHYTPAWAPGTQPAAGTGSGDYLPVESNGQARPSTPSRPASSGLRHRRGVTWPGPSLTNSQHRCRALAAPTSAVRRRPY